MKVVRCIVDVVKRTKQEGGAGNVVGYIIIYLVFSALGPKYPTLPYVGRNGRFMLFVLIG